MRVTPRLIKQKARRQAQWSLIGSPKAPRIIHWDPPTDCRRLVSGSISLPALGCFSPFPHGTMFAIGCRVVFSLGWWSTQIPSGFHVPRGTREHVPGRDHAFRLRGYHPLRRVFPNTSAKRVFCNSPAGSWPGPDMSHDPRAATPTSFDTTRV